jgi:hypothetical protein
VLDFDAIEPAGRPLLAQILRMRYQLPVVAMGTKSAIFQQEFIPRFCWLNPRLTAA